MPTLGGYGCPIECAIPDHPERRKLLDDPRVSRGRFFTLANAACGVAAVFCAMKYLGSQALVYFYVAAALAPAALVFDVLDGRIARSRQEHSALGRELDSLADVISFGVAPATLGFAAGLSGGWDWVVLLYFVCCGVNRLARYNVTAERSEGAGKVVYFEGTPIPTSVLLVAIPCGRVAGSDRRTLARRRVDDRESWDLHPLVLLFSVRDAHDHKTLRILEAGGPDAKGVRERRG